MFRWLGIAPALDPAVTLTSACLGYWLRQNGPTALLSPGYPCVETRQGAVIQQIFWAWIPLLGVDKVADLLRIVAGQYTRRQHFHFLRQLKLALVFTPGGMKTLFPIFENSWFEKQELAVANIYL